MDVGCTLTAPKTVVRLIDPVVAESSMPKLQLLIGGWDVGAPLAAADQACAQFDPAISSGGAVAERV
jgi:hypothetical protein